MPGKKAELRVDPADGNAYLLYSFLECYGEDEGQRRWATAGQDGNAYPLDSFPPRRGRKMSR